MSEIEHRTTINEGRIPIAGIGPVGAQVMLVGEAPGADEARLGVPFGGASASLLLSLMGNVGLSRGDCYITNVVKEHPKGNDITPFLTIGTGIAKESPDFKRYVQELKAEIEAVKPNVIVAVGGTALWALCGLRGILNWRGSVLECTLSPGTKVIPIVHPAAALREYPLRHLIAFDLKKIAKEAQSADLYKDRREYILRPTFQESLDFIQACYSASLVGFDIEVASREVSCISFAYTPVGGITRAISIPFTEYVKDYFNPPQEAQIIREIGALLENPNVAKVGHNSIFDTTFLYRRYGIKPKNIHDTMIGHALLYPDFKKGLALVTSLYTTLPYYKEDGKKQIASGNSIISNAGSQQNFWLYNARDSVAVVEALPSIFRQLERSGNRPTYDRQINLIEPFLFMCDRGIAMDKEGLTFQSGETAESIEALKKEIRELVGHDLNPSSAAQMKAFFYEEMGIKPYRSRKTHAETTDEGALKRLAKNKNPIAARVAQLLLKYREDSKMRSTYYDVALDSDNRLRCSINIVGTKFGRVSSSKTIFGTGANMQNQPPEMKRFMHPDPGYVGYEMDLGQAENRVVAYLSGDPNMIAAFQDGRDIHTQTAALIFAKPYEEVSRKKGSAPLGGGRLSERDWGKRANHGLNYGQTDRLSAFLWEIPENEARFIVEKYHSAYPYVREWQNRIRNDLARKRSLTNIFGRTCTFWGEPGQDMAKAGYAFIPQSTIADLMNSRGIIPLYYDQATFHGAEFILTVHDSIMFQIPLDLGWEYHAEVLWAMKQSLETPLEYLDRSFSIPADAKMLPRHMKGGDDEELIITNLDTLPFLLADKYNQLTADA